MTKLKNVKFSINLPQDTYDILHEFVLATGSTKGGFICEVLDSQKDALKALTETVKKAQLQASKTAEKKASFLDT